MQNILRKRSVLFSDLEHSADGPLQLSSGFLCWGWQLRVLRLMFGQLPVQARNYVTAPTSSLGAAEMPLPAHFSWCSAPCSDVLRGVASCEPPPPHPTPTRNLHCD